VITLQLKKIYILPHIKNTMKKGSLIKEDLHKGEKIEAEATPDVWAYLGHWIGGGFICLITIFLLAIPGIIYIFIANQVRKGNKYYVTNKRVIHEFTFLSRKVSGTPYNKIQDVHMTQGLIERMLGIGTIHINTAGSHNMEVVFKGVKHPRAMKKKIEKHII